MWQRGIDAAKCILRTQLGDALDASEHALGMGMGMQCDINHALAMSSMGPR